MLNRIKNIVLRCQLPRPILLGIGIYGGLFPYNSKFSQIGMISFAEVHSNKLPDEIESSTTAKNAVSIEVNDSDLADDDTWEKKKELCSFCAMFLNSPCSLHFKRWSTCVDNAKAAEQDYVTGCSLYTKALMQCTSENNAYFEAKSEEDKTDEEKDEQ